MNYNELNNYYLEIINKEKQKLEPLKKQIFLIALLRFIWTIGGILLSYILWSHTFYLISNIFIFLLGFIVLLKIHDKLFYKKNYALTMIQLAENECKSINYDFSPFDSAPENILTEHSFCYDLDLFGERSLFQSINRTITKMGKKYLSDLFLYPLSDKQKIIEQQEAIKELTGSQQLIHHFRVIGNLDKKEDIDTTKFTPSFSHKNLLYKNKFWETVSLLVPVIFLITLVLCFTGMLPFITFIPLWLITFALSSSSIKSIHTVLDIFDKKTDQLSNYHSLFQLIENQKFESNLLNTNQNFLKSGTTQASLAIKKLERYCSNINMGLSYPVVLFFNPVLFWNVRYAIKIEQWIEKHLNEIPLWFEALSRFDALSSLSVFSYNHPDYIYPLPITDHFNFEGKDLGHPLIPRDICIKNDIQIKNNSFFMVITGANMAGKSTYLRTIGVTHLLACIGAPVCAKTLNFYPGNLVTNLRTTDSLVDNESYFFSELKRLKMIIDRLKSGEQLFIILDEILKGTNSEDKQKGSLALMKQLIQLNGNGIIATHDLVLGCLENEYPNHIKNYRFEADITHDKLSFTYKMQEGIAKNMNATYLMKQMGITGL
ncbi:hypothetical protein [Apibacter sp. HY039]|uniref:MutS-related protein n=1 Tax=Apibacter sp. HY039 TaxID=2501476 RepID=UPI000FEBF252|nr:hypothetical protein [Apibacter sp. HY039]